MKDLSINHKASKAGTPEKNSPKLLSAAHLPTHLAAQPEFSRAVRLAGKFRALLASKGIQFRGKGSRITDVFLKSLHQGQGPPGGKSPDLDVLVSELPDLKLASWDPKAPLALKRTRKSVFHMELPVALAKAKTPGTLAPDEEVVYLTFRGIEFLDNQGAVIGCIYKAWEVFASRGIAPDLGERVSDLSPPTMSNS